jgi:hypothetical protein
VKAFADDPDLPLLVSLDVPRASVKIGYAETVATWTVELDYGARHNNTTTHGTARFRRIRVGRAIAEWAHTDSLRRARGWKSHRKSAGNDCRPGEAAAIEGSLSRLGLGRSRTRRAAGSRVQFPLSNIRLRDFDGSHLTLPGMVLTSLRDGDLSPHQKNAVWCTL